MNEFAAILRTQYAPENIHAKNHKEAIVMYSGGMDSTVSLWWALNRYEHVRILTVNYYQPHIMEIKHANRIVSMLGMKSRSIHVDFPLDFWGLKNHLTRGQACLMTSLAAIDIGHEGADIVMGILNTDDYGDCKRDFLDSLADVLFHDLDSGSIGIATPLRAVPAKADVVAMGLKCGAPIGLTWTCRVPRGGEPCHECLQCRARDAAFREFYAKYRMNPKEYGRWSDCLGSPCHPIIQQASLKLTMLRDIIENLNGMRKAIPMYCYLAPDNTWRVSSHIHNLKKRNLRQTFKMVKGVVARGINEMDDSWEVCFMSDGTIAYTDNLPDYQVIEDSVVKRVEL